MAMEMREELALQKAAWRLRGFVDPFQTVQELRTLLERFEKSAVQP